MPTSIPCSKWSPLLEVTWGGLQCPSCRVKTAFTAKRCQGIAWGSCTPRSPWFFFHRVFPKRRQLRTPDIPKRCPLSNPNIPCDLAELLFIAHFGVVPLVDIGHYFYSTRNLCKASRTDGYVDHLVRDQGSIHRIIQPHIKSPSLWVSVAACICDIKCWRFLWHQGYVYLYIHYYAII